MRSLLYFNVGENTNIGEKGFCTVQIAVTFPPLLGVFTNKDLSKYLKATLAVELGYCRISILFETPASAINIQHFLRLFAFVGCFHQQRFRQKL
jgi:hypothetical protein